MTNALSIISVGPPPERHADRVVAAMLRQLAETRAHLFPAICAVICGSSDGSPRAQRKLETRIKEAGALQTLLTPGKRGRYTLKFIDCTGWDPTRDAEIMIADALPPQPWLAYHINIIASTGGGRNDAKLSSEAFLFVTHHALSRAAQRADGRTVADLLIASEVILNTMQEFAVRIEWEQALAAPPEGWRVPLHHNENFSVVLKRHEKRKALIAATLFRIGAPR